MERFEERAARLDFCGGFITNDAEQIADKALNLLSASLLMKYV
jgi:hypothetical protein